MELIEHNPAMNFIQNLKNQLTDTSTLKTNLGLNVDTVFEVRNRRNEIIQVKADELDVIISKRTQGIKELIVKLLSNDFVASEKKIYAFQCYKEKDYFGVWQCNKSNIASEINTIFEHIAKPFSALFRDYELLANDNSNIRKELLYKYLKEIDTYLNKASERLKFLDEFPKTLKMFNLVISEIDVPKIEFNNFQIVVFKDFIFDFRYNENDTNYNYDLLSKVDENELKNLFLTETNCLEHTKPKLENISEPAFIISFLRKFLQLSENDIENNIFGIDERIIIDYLTSILIGKPIEKAIIFKGNAGNGKGTFFSLLNVLFGETVYQISPNAIEIGYNKDTHTDRINWAMKRVLYIDEFESYKTDWNFLKTITSDMRGEYKAKILYVGTVSIPITFSLFFATNFEINLPESSNKDVKRRVEIQQAIYNFSEKSNPIDANKVKERFKSEISDFFGLLVLNYIKNPKTFLERRNRLLNGNTSMTEREFYLNVPLYKYLNVWNESEQGLISYNMPTSFISLAQLQRDKDYIEYEALQSVFCQIYKDFKDTLNFIENPQKDNYFKQMLLSDNNITLNVGKNRNKVYGILKVLKEIEMTIYNNKTEINYSEYENRRIMAISENRTKANGFIQDNNLKFGSISSIEDENSSGF